ncbi:MAG: alpha-hydroxy-acid oxidizing protein [Devosia nanyangense]|uniref:Alpha-hydroxy-acid oxidizing protein n=1 Tax=Devosia nanyangense TaxID=1228055 RepID=A0A933L2Q9_9HYPH|nr:alpha-hydroxy-acid oxidizing protein [Devosia nanyangense]
MTRLDRFLTVDDFMKVAERRVPRMFFQYADSGAYTEGTYRDNSADFGKIRLEQRVGRDIAGRSLTTTMLGRTVSMPLALAPTGAAGMQAADGEIKAARAAEKAGIIFTLSTVSICSIEDVAAATSVPFWFQFYVRKDRDFNERLIDRARAAKCGAIVVTLDCQLGGQRHKDVRNGLTVPLKMTPKFVAEMAMKPRWSLAMLRTRHRTFGNFAGHVPGATTVAALAEWMSQQDDLTLTWTDLLWIKKRFGGPLVVKGILHPDDAREAVAHGADAIIVSNHGGRQLDGAPSTIRVLPRIVDAVGGKCEIYLDSGVRSGHDMLKAVALGARAVFIGRPFLYGLGVAGEAGVDRVIDIIRAEADTTLGLMGETDVTTLGAHNIESNDLIAPHGH